jgi:hypothetical protein
MRCISCDVDLTDFESTRRYETGAFLDLCNDCYQDVGEDIVTINRMDLITIGDEQ